MADSNATIAQQDDQIAATPESAAEAYADSLFKSINHCKPGIVKSYDAATQTASVQPAIRRVWTDRGAMDLPVCVDVPVVVLGGGDLFLTFPIAEGDECLLLFGDRAIDFWFDRGGVQDPAEYRLHDLSDAFALVGVASRPRMLAGVSTDAAELRTRDGATIVRVKGGQIDHVADTVNVGADAGTQATVMGETYRSAEDTLFNALSTFASVLAGACTGVTDLPHELIAINAIGPAASPLVTAIGTFQAAASTYLTTKAKVL